MPRAEFPAAVRRDGDFVGEHAVLVIEDLQRSRVLGLRGRAFVAARHQDHLAIVRRHAHLVREDAGVQRALLHFLSRREVLVDAVDVERARAVERHQDVLRRDIQRHVDRAGRQAYRLAVLRQRTARRVDAKRGDVMLGSGLAVTGSAAARRDVQIAPRDMGPRILHARGQRDRVPPDQRCALHVHVVVRELGPHVGIERHLARGLLRGGQAGRGDTAGGERQESFAEHRDPPVRLWRVVRDCRQILHLPAARSP